MNNFCCGWTCCYLVPLFTFSGVCWSGSYCGAWRCESEPSYYKPEQITKQCCSLFVSCSIVEHILDLLTFLTHAVSVGSKKFVMTFPKITRKQHPSSLLSTGEDPRQVECCGTSIHSLRATRPEGWKPVVCKMVVCCGCLCCKICLC